LFLTAAKRATHAETSPELVKVYEKIHNGVWVFNGIFELLDAWDEVSGGRESIQIQVALGQ